MIVKVGGDPLATSNEGKVPLSLAVSQNHSALVIFLTKKTRYCIDMLNDKKVVKFVCFFNILTNGLSYMSMFSSQKIFWQPQDIMTTRLLKHLF